jgi:hypothetical protein
MPPQRPCQRLRGPLPRTPAGSQAEGAALAPWVVLAQRRLASRGRAGTPQELPWTVGALGRGLRDGAGGRGMVIWGVYRITVQMCSTPSWLLATPTPSRGTRRGGHLRGVCRLGSPWQGGRQGAGVHGGQAPPPPDHGVGGTVRVVAAIRGSATDGSAEETPTHTWGRSRQALHAASGEQ